MNSAVSLFDRTILFLLCKQLLLSFIKKILFSLTGCSSVRVFVETVKKVKEDEWLRKADITPELQRISFLENEKGYRVCGVKSKLSQLNLRNVNFPPEVLKR